LEEKFIIRRSPDQDRGSSHESARYNWKAEGAHSPSGKRFAGEGLVFLPVFQVAQFSNLRESA